MRRFRTMVALGTAAFMFTAGAALAATPAQHSRVTRAQSVHRQLLATRRDLVRQRLVYRRDLAYRRDAYRRDLAYQNLPPRGYYPPNRPLDYRDVYPVGAYGSVDALYGYPPGGIIARRTIENQRSPGLSSELDYSVKQTATGGPVGGPLNGGAGR